MLASPVRRGIRKQRVAVGLFSLGLVLGGIATALGAWLIGGLVRWTPLGWRELAVAAMALLGILRDLRVVRFPLPENARQVPQSVFYRGLGPAALQFGFEMGTGLRTHLTSTAPYVLVGAVLLLVDRAPLAIVIGASFGLGRALMALSRASSADGEHWDGRLGESLRWLVPASTILCCAGLAWAIVA